MLLLSYADLKINLFKNYFGNTIRVSKGLDPNCFQRSSADDKINASRQRVNQAHHDLKVI